MTERSPNLVPRPTPFDTTRFPVPSAHVFLADLLVGDDELSTVVDHVTNTEYVRWLDRAAELHADTLGFTRAWLLANGIMWFVARHEIDYLGEVHRGDRLVVATWVRNVERVKSWRGYTIIRPSDGRVVCRAATLWVLVDLASRRPHRLPAVMKDRLDAVVAPPLIERTRNADDTSTSGPAPTRQTPASPAPTEEVGTSRPCTSP